MKFHTLWRGGSGIKNVKWRRTAWNRVKIPNVGVKRLGFYSKPCYSLAVCLWASHLEVDFLKGRAPEQIILVFHWFSSDQFSQSHLKKKGHYFYMDIFSIIMNLYRWQNSLWKEINACGCIWFQGLELKPGETQMRVLTIPFLTSFIFQGTRTHPPVSQPSLQMSSLESNTPFREPANQDRESLWHAYKHITGRDPSTKTSLFSREGV